MTPPSPENSSVRRVVLPSGREVEVMRFDAPMPAPRTAPLHLCPECRGEHVQAVDWHPAPRDDWELELRCPNCGWAGDGIFAHALVEAFEAELERATRSLVADLRRLRRARLEDEVERFAHALAGDHLLPEDF